MSHLLGVARRHEATLVLVGLPKPTVGAVPDALRQLTKFPELFQIVEPHLIRRATAIPNDPNYSLEWPLQNISAERAWDIQRGSAGVVVAVTDTGIDYNHPDLATRVWINPGEKANNHIDDDHNGYVDDYRGYNFAYENNNPYDDMEHGTFVSSLIGAAANDGFGMAGVCWNVRIMAVKIMDSYGLLYTMDEVRGYDYARVMGAKIVNASLGGDYYSQSEYDAIGRLRQRGSEIRAELHKIEAAPYPSNHCKAKMRQQIEALSQAGRPDVTMLVAHDGEIAFQTRSLRSKVYGETQLLRELAFAEVPDANALVAWAFKDVLIARLDAEINAVCNDRVALTHETRQLQSAKLQGDLLLIERDECSLTWARKGKVCRSSTVPTSTRSRCSACAWSRRRSSTDAAAPMHVVVPLCTLLLPAMRRDAAIARARSTGGVPG